MSNRGEHVIMVGYGGHTNSSNTYQLFKPRTRQIVVSRNVRWEKWHGIGDSSAPLMEGIFNQNSLEEAPRISSDPGTPSNWKELWNNLKLRKKWRDSACNEIENFLRRDAWKLFPRRELNGRKPIGSKYVFKEKLEQYGSIRLKTQIVIKGYTQIPGIDFTETFSPVANDTTIRVAISYALYKATWIPHVIDIEAAFLEADLHEVILARIGQKV
jgi:Reverse transcriptase (RNA-dependent DNA polymerase).